MAKLNAALTEYLKRIPYEEDTFEQRIINYLNNSVYADSYVKCVAVKPCEHSYYESYDLILEETKKSKINFRWDYEKLHKT